MDIALLFLGIYCLIMGIVGIIWPYKMTKLGEAIESTKNQRPRQEVDPMARGFRTYEIGGVIGAIFGAVILLVRFIYL
ncbi:hypothetical protein [Halosolutus halophilus]|uniref:hypothetical protein n=1 Tax=Halosolutus halophilus TaxID=1552990 RepID=UPI0022352C5D|nr:hypothetical protein [Halosolutus halophilus]